jgi:hypothetical protein
LTDILYTSFYISFNSYFVFRVSQCGRIGLDGFLAVSRAWERTTFEWACRPPLLGDKRRSRHVVTHSVPSTARARSRVHVHRRRPFPLSSMSCRGLSPRILNHTINCTIICIIYMLPNCVRSRTIGPFDSKMLGSGGSKSN